MVVQKELLGGRRCEVDGSAYVASDSAFVPPEGGTCQLQHRGGSDCTLTASTRDPHGLQVPPGCIALDKVQRINMHVAENAMYDFEIVDRAEELVDIELEACLLPASVRLQAATDHEPAPEPDSAAGVETAAAAVLSEGEDEVIVLKAKDIEAVFAKQFFQRQLAMHEKCVVRTLAA